jgi:hypothetical protein
MSAAAVRLAKLVMEDPERARVEAARIVASAKSQRKRQAAKSLPRRRKERADAITCREANAETREIVMARARMRCEICGLTPYDLHLEWHHLCPGPMRRKFSGPNATCAACIPCHRKWHNGDPDTLERSYQLAGAINAPKLVLDALRRRIEKATPAPPPERTTT